MLSDNRKYNFYGKLFIKKSRTLKSNSQPKDDTINWLFLNINDHQYSFVYKIENPSIAIYNKPFKISIAFTMSEEVKNIIQLNYTYEVLRGQENIGTLEIVSAIN